VRSTETSEQIATTLSDLFAAGSLCAPIGQA
jgi:hypothetical protein